MNNLLDIIKVIILGIVEGMTEFLPVSSTGHLIIVGQFLTLKPESFANAFAVIIQLGAILSVVVLSFDKLYPFSKKYLPKEKLHMYEKTNPQTKAYMLLKYPNLEIISLWTKIIVGVIPAAVLGYLFDDLIDKYLFNPLVVAGALIFYGFILIYVENRNEKREVKFRTFEELDYKTAFKIGLFQCLAMVPGTSRSAATIIGGLILGADRVLATEFSFYLAIPTMIGATLLKIVKGSGSYSMYQWFLILLGFLVSFIVAYLVIKKFLNYIRKNDFKIFAYYRIILGIIVILSIFLTK